MIFERRTIKINNNALNVQLINIQAVHSVGANYIAL